MNFDALKNEPRILFEARLTPAQGHRFQPTGFPDLGAAEYTVQTPKGAAQMLLVESAQSMANRLENAIWDEANDDLVPELKGLPYVRSNIEPGVTTTSIQEAHRLNSPFIVTSDKFGQIKEDIGYKKGKPFDRRALAKALLKYDPNSLLHGIFLEKVGGTVRLPRCISAFVEAKNVLVVASGGVKFDRVQPETGGESGYGKAKDGYGNVPFHRDEYTAQEITAYFNIDLALLRGLGLEAAAQDMLIALALFKVRRFLHSGLRLRTACDLEVAGDVVVKRPKAWAVPGLDALEKALPKLIEKAGPGLADPVVTVTQFTGSKKKDSKDEKSTAK